MILVAGPYHSETGDDPHLIEQNRARLEAMAIPLFLKGHIPMIGEWVAQPLMKLAGSEKIGDEIFTEIQYTVAHGLLKKCDAILRIEGASKDADQDVELGKQLGLKIFLT
ncbi:MAG: hypothetical protein ACI9FN_001408 [Saprospiraceae bacterium]